MTKKLWQVCWKYNGFATVHRSEPKPKDEAAHAVRVGNRNWGDMIRHWMEPAPEIVQDDTTTPRNVEPE